MYVNVIYETSKAYSFQVMRWIGSYNFIDTNSQESFIKDEKIMFFKSRRRK